MLYPFMLCRALPYFVHNLTPAFLRPLFLSFYFLPLSARQSSPPLKKVCIMKQKICSATEVISSKNATEFHFQNFQKCPFPNAYRELTKEKGNKENHVPTFWTLIAGIKFRMSTYLLKTIHFIRLYIKYCDFWIVVKKGLHIIVFCCYDILHIVPTIFWNWEFEKVEFIGLWMKPYHV